MQIPYALIMCSGNLHLCSGMSSTTCSRQVLVCVLLIKMSVTSIRCSTDLLSPSWGRGGWGWDSVVTVYSQSLFFSLPLPSLFFGLLVQW